MMLPRTSQEISRLGAKIPLAELMPGDLVFFNTRRLQFSHVGIYLGEDRFIHAPRQGGEVEVVTLSKLYWQKHFDGARRLVGALPALIPSAHAETASIDTPPSGAGSFAAYTFCIFLSSSNSIHSTRTAGICEATRLPTT